MAKTFGEKERRICSLFKVGTKFKYKGNEYEVVFADKPVCAKGEPKTDIFIRTHLVGGTQYDPTDFKISYKKTNADFIENKTNAERAELLFGENWMRIVEDSTIILRDKFEKRPLIFKNKSGKTDAGVFTLGWKFELLRVHSGDLSNKMELTYQQKLDVYAGTNLPTEKKDAIVNGMTIHNSGVADFIYEEKRDAATVQDVIDNMQTIEEFLSDYPNIYYACKALNYRSFKDKYDGNRPLSVFVEWYAENGKLCHKLVYDKPLVTRGNEVYAGLRRALDELHIQTTDDVNESNVSDEGIIFS